MQSSDSGRDIAVSLIVWVPGGSQGFYTVNAQCLRQLRLLLFWGEFEGERRELANPKM